MGKFCKTTDDSVDVIARTKNYFNCTLFSPQMEGELLFFIKKRKKQEDDEEEAGFQFDILSLFSAYQRSSYL